MLFRSEGGNIQVHAPGSVTFHAGQKNWTGAQSVQAPAVRLGAPSPLDRKHFLQFVARDVQGKPLANKPYVLFMPDGSTKKGKTDASGKTEKVTTEGPQRVTVYIDDEEHKGFRLSSMQT